MFNFFQELAGVGFEPTIRTGYEPGQPPFACTLLYLGSKS